jgi:hypothetical protein
VLERRPFGVASKQPVCTTFSTQWAALGGSSSFARTLHESCIVVRMVSSRAALWALLTSSFIACGGAETPPPATPESDAASAPPPAAEATPAPTPAAPEAEAKPAEAADAPAADTAAKDSGGKDGGGESDSARNVKYIVNPDGMRVEVDGVTFAPKAELVKSGAGWAIKLKVDVRAKDGNSHSLLAPKGTEVAIGGLIKRSGQAEPEMPSDQRAGDTEIVLKDKPVTLTRTWPAADGPKALMAGDEADLLVGIWGLGDNAASRRMVRKLCKLSVKVDKAKPRVVVGPPDGVGK